jgi:hypothetical protein
MKSSTKKAVGIGLGLGAIALGAYALTRKASAAPPAPPPPPAPGYANLYGTVKNSQTGSTIPLAILILDSQTTTSGQDGSYSFSNLQPGDYFTTVEAIGYETVAGTVSLVEGNNPLDFSLTPLAPPPSGQANLGGTVTDKTTGQPISGVIVSILGTSLSLMTDSNGFYKFTLPVGGYVVTAEVDGYETGTQGIQVIEGDNTLNFSLAPVGQYPPTPPGTVQIKSLKVITTTSGIECEFVIDNQTGRPWYQALPGASILYAFIFSENVPGYIFRLFEIQLGGIIPMGLSVWHGEADTYGAALALQLLAGQVCIANFSCVAQPSGTPQSFTGTPGPSWQEWTEIPYILPPQPPEIPIVVPP